MTPTDTQTRARAHALLYRRRVRAGYVQQPATDLVAYAAKAWMNARGLPTGSRNEWVEAWIDAWKSTTKQGRPRVNAADTHISVCVPQDVKTAYRTAARRRGITMTELVREVLVAAFSPSTAHTSSPSPQSPAPSSSRSPTDP